MTKKCIGCGTILQTTNEQVEGYIQDLSQKICERCFKIRNYGQYKVVDKTNTDFIPIIKEIGKTDDLVVLVVDLFNISKDIYDLSEYLNNDVLLVLTKRDILPLSTFDENLRKIEQQFSFNILNTIIISSKKNYNLDELMQNIHQYKKSNNVYVVGYTNAGKSSLINKLIYNYYETDLKITTSILPSTTLNTIEIKLDDTLTLIDTPGLLDEHDITNYVSIKDLKKIIPNKEIKPITYQIKEKQSIYLEHYLRLDILSKNNMTLYISNALNVKRVFKLREEPHTFEKHELTINKNEDIVISGLGFIKCSYPGQVIVYTIKGVNVFTRKNLI